MSQKKPLIGCELQPKVMGQLDRLKDAGLLDHVQITVPNTITFQEALSFADRIPCIAHCNLLNTFGENDWSELRPVIRQLKALKPLHVVEHFTLLRHSNGQKSGVYFDPAFAQGLTAEKTIRNVKRWQAEIELPLCLENVPYVENARAYFDFLIEVKQRTGCQIACDVPHFLISAISSRFTDREIQAYAHALDPTQLHLGGISSSQGILRDNHRGLSPWVVAQAKALFKNVMYATLEQSHHVPTSQVELQLGDLSRCYSEPSVPVGTAPTGMGLSMEALNQELARDVSISNGFPWGQNLEDQAPTPFDSAAKLYDKYVPFMNPIAALKNQLPQLKATDAVKAVVSLARWALSYQSWWYPDAKCAAQVSYGQGTSSLFLAPIGNAGASDDHGFHTITFPLQDSFWISVASQKLPQPATEEWSTYDQRAV